MDDADGGNGKYECAGTQESRKRDKLLQFTLLLKKMDSFMPCVALAHISQVRKLLKRGNKIAVRTDG
jgi:hypothetical protein